MGILTKIFNFDREKLEALEFRNNARYTPNEHFPLVTQIKFKKRCMNVKIHNISKGGMALRPPKSLGKIPLQKTDRIEVTLCLFESKTIIFGRVTHFNQEILGLQLETDPLGPLLEYHHLIYPILIGRSMSEHVSSSHQQTVYTGMEDSKMIFYKNGEGEYEKVEIILGKDNIQILGLGPAPIKLLFSRLQNPTNPIKTSDQDYQSYFQFYKWFLLHLDTTFSLDQINFLKNVSATI